MLRLEYFQAGGDAACTLEWIPADFDAEQEALEAARNSDVIVFVGGLDAMLEGEEQVVPYPGFRGGDRTDLKLPEIQQSLLKKLAATGKPVVLVLCSGSALGVEWAAEHVPAIMQLWYPGAEGGRALADVLFGAYNPSGRLPVTIYRKIEDLPPFESYEMTGRTYRYFEGEPLYAFGHGLSYTSFQYDNLQLARMSGKSDSLELHFRVRNTGAFDGDEVIQIYGRILDAQIPVPKHSLIGFKRVHLKKGEARDIRMQVSLRALAVYTDEELKVLPGNYQVFAGGAQPGYATVHTSIISDTIRIGR
jgi:beta-glucosidase